jgi:D-amino-acid dehydrogenase
MLAFAQAMRPLFSNAVAEHETLIIEAGVSDVLRKTGWLKIYRHAATYESAQRDLDVIATAGIGFDPLDQSGALKLEPDVAPIFERAVFWPSAASISNPLRLTLAYAALLAKHGGVFAKGDASTLRRADGGWQVATGDGPVSASSAVIALGPWANDVLEPLGLHLPLMAKRGYHRHYRATGNKGLSRPVLDAEIGYVAAPMEQGIRLTTGAEFAPRDAAPTPVQFRFVEPAAREMFPIGEAVEPAPWLGSRPCFPDSMPVIGRAPGHKDLWLDFGHAHWGLTLGPVSGRLLADMMTGATPFTDPTPFRPERFS